MSPERDAPIKMAGYSTGHFDNNNNNNNNNSNNNNNNNNNI